MGGGGVSGLRFLDRLIQPWTGGGEGGRGGGGPGLSKGEKIFDTRFGLIHVQTGKKNFCQGDPPLVKGNFFDTRFGLIHVQTGKKNFCQGTPPHPPGIARNCYGHAAGGMPLAFTQEDFLVENCFQCSETYSQES